MAAAPAHQNAPLALDYPELLAGVTARVTAARTRTAFAVNSALIQLYWEIGHDILEREGREGWGARVVDRLAVDLRRAFPDMTGLSRSNLHYMRAFAAAWPLAGIKEIVQQPVGQLPWGHNIVLLTKLHDPAARVWYAVKCIENGWSRAVLEAQIASDLRGRQGSALTSFERALPSPESELVRGGPADRAAHAPS